MSDSPVSQGSPESAGPQDVNAALFASMVMQQANLALMMLGRVPHPETGQRVKNPVAARMFIDQLEMLEAKTKGNLSSEETQLLRDSLTTLRMAFVEAVQSAPAEPARPEASTAAPQPGGSGAASAPSSSTEPPPAEESHKKFTKKY